MEGGKSSRRAVFALIWTVCTYFPSVFYRAEQQDYCLWTAPAKPSSLHLSYNLAGRIQIYSAVLVSTQRRSQTWKA